MSGVTGLQWISRMASRYRSVARKVIVSPSISTLTPVRMGRVSSLEAAVITCETARANAAPSTVPAVSGMPGSSGYSSTGIVESVNFEDRQVRSTRES